MTAYAKMTPAEREAEYKRLQGEFEALKARGLKLNMARGKPGKAQLDMVSDIFGLMQRPEDYVSDGIDVRNYGEMRGLPAAQRLFADILGGSAPPPAMTATSRSRRASDSSLSPSP